MLHDAVFGLVDQGVDALLAAVFDVDGFALFQEIVGSVVRNCGCVDGDLIYTCILDQGGLDDACVCSVFAVGPAGHRLLRMQFGFDFV